PLVRRHFKLPLVIITSLDGADVPVVSGVSVCGGEWKCCFEIRRTRMPVNDVAELYAIAAIARGQSHCLLKLRAFRFAHNLDRHAHWTIFNNTNLRRAADVSTRWFLLIAPIYIPRRPLSRLIIFNCEPQRSIKQLAVELFVEDARDVSIGVHRDSVAVIFKGRGRYPQR